MATISPPIKIDSTESLIVTLDVSEAAKFPRGLNLKWEGKEYHLVPGRPKIVPFDIVRLNWGDPRSVFGTQQYIHDKGGRVVGDIPDREKENMRLAVMYGLYEDKVDQVPILAPAVTITDTEGHEIIPPAFDPSGDVAYGSVADENLDNVHDVATLLSQLKKRVARLEQENAALIENGNNDEDIEADIPSM